MSPGPASPSPRSGLGRGGVGRLAGARRSFRISARLTPCHSPSRGRSRGGDRVDVGSRKAQGKGMGAVAALLHSDCRRPGPVVPGPSGSFLRPGVPSHLGHP